MFLWPIPVLLSITVFAAWFTSVMRGMYSKKVTSSAQGIWFFNLVQNLLCGITVAVIFLLSGGLGDFSLFSVALGSLMGLACMISLFAFLKACAIGPFSYSTVILSLSSIIPALSGLFFGETISIVQCIGILLMAVCIMLSPEASAPKEEKKTGIKWILLCAVSAIGSGGVGVAQKFHQSSSVHGDEWAAFLLSGFLVSSLLSAGFLFINKQPKNKEQYRITKIWILPAVVGIIFAFQHSINLFLVGKLEAIIVFPLVNLLPMILSIVTGFMLFKERLSLKRTVGLLVGILSCVLLSGIF